MTYPILITVRDRNQAYHCRHDGVAASSTSNPGAAVQRLADKLFGEGTHRVRMVRDCRSGEPGEWAIEPATLPDHLQAASVRITLADDGQPWTEDDALADAYFSTGTEPELFSDYWALISRIHRWRERHAPTAERLSALADKMDRVCSGRFGPDWNIPF